MLSNKETLDLTIKKACDVKDNMKERRDPTCYLPEESMSYEFKVKKKKKKRKKQEDPFRDLNDEKGDFMTPQEPVLEMKLETEVTIKVENIEVELDINDFANYSSMVEDNGDDLEEPIVKLEEQNREAVLLTFENVVTNGDDPAVLGYNNDSTIETAPNHVCKVCHLVFQSLKTLKMHQRRKHKSFRKSFKHICDYCGMSYEMKNSLVAHMKRKHAPGVLPDDNSERACEICSLVFKGISRLRMHMRRKHNSFEDSFKHACSECGLTYDKYRSLHVHIQRKHGDNKPTENQWYNCPFCPKIFTRRETYSRHVQRKHQISEEDANKKAKDMPDYFENCQNVMTGEVTCRECPLVFSSINSLKLHMRRKHNALKEDFRLKCRICNLSYDKIESLKRHVRRKHDEEGCYCELCNKQFETREAYVSHSHVKVTKECSICGLIFASQGGLGKHLRCTHKIESPKVAFCSICNEGFHDKRQVKPHLLKVHFKVSYTCKDCKKVFKARESYRRHILVQHNKTDKPEQECSKCSEKFPDEFELCRHINTAHVKSEDSKSLLEIKKEETDEKESFPCKQCPEIYFSWELLKTHYESNHFKCPKTQCQVCGAMVPETELQKHIKTIHTVTTQTCRYCEFQTTIKASMTQHLLRHKTATTLQCDFNGCRYKSYYEGAMEKHKQKHQECGKFQCTKCPFQSMNKYILRYHEEAHVTGKKKYSCDQCEYATILPANLVQHKYKHSSEKRFKCEVCPFATKYNTSLRFHVKKKHCDLPSDS